MGVCIYAHLQMGRLRFKGFKQPATVTEPETKEGLDPNRPTLEPVLLTRADMQTS